MSQLAFTLRINEDHYYLEVYIDPFNKRIRVDDYRGNLNQVLSKAEDLVKQNQAEKLIIKGRKEDTIGFFEWGLQPEAMVDHYFLGSDAYFYSKYYSADRKKNDHWITEDGIIKSIYQLNKTETKTLPPKEYELIRLDESHASMLSGLYRQVFQIYPTPLNDPDYIIKTMKDGTIYYAYFHQGEIVSAASAEINDFYKNAELTDCATLPEHRKYGLMKMILKELEGELKRRGIFCAYSIARSLSFGMNAVLYQLGYAYRGRLMNNVYIYDKLENMNMWVKNLSSC
ncbi:putative beta-lysine N-acetyltransferase [Bacillus thermocopriae]|uniref:Putative beta-lysine N-acetyltransferase n=1 Tax=Neobacillus thermocopriae TaxID=1215031 RepID=A0A6B3TSF0_9BACI|nr:putative beta-lysine N-acetyltransferase [Neobacillus thermocopriae]MED3625469.1 putative beta-lysine N-acetyltransferase [Neobacillus thermocopriae]MED3714614.1 putative beta-lysine N-acetyltransferase [Neobacillus thermocopriae]NEX78941.1 putative beta-lysine N-acetyltransferase [Neobacillus thermocopriae]